MREKTKEYFSYVIYFISINFLFFILFDYRPKITFLNVAVLFITIFLLSKFDLEIFLKRHSKRVFNCMIVVILTTFLELMIIFNQLDFTYMLDVIRSNYFILSVIAIIFSVANIFLVFSIDYKYSTNPIEQALIKTIIEIVVIESDLLEPEVKEHAIKDLEVKKSEKEKLGELVNSQNFTKMEIFLIILKQTLPPILLLVLSKLLDFIYYPFIYNILISIMIIMLVRLAIKVFAFFFFTLKYSVKSTNDQITILISIVALIISLATILMS